MRSENPIICQVLHSLTVGGAEVLAARLARNVRDRYRCVFACLDDLGPLGEQLRDQGFRVEVLGRRPGVDLRCMRALAGFWRAEGVDLVHAHQYTPFFYSLGARAMRSGPPVLFTEHGRFFPDYPRRRRIWFNRLMLRECDRVVAVGEAVRQALIDNEGISDRRVEVIYNGVDPSRFRNASTDAADVRREMGVSPEDFAVIQVARLDQLKDHSTAIRMVACAVEHNPDIHLVLVGDGPERERIEWEIRWRGVGRHVHLLGLRQDIPRLLRAADLFLLTSISEGIPVTVIEAMAAGLPVVSTDVGGVREIVEDERTGMLSLPGDEEALARAILRLAGDGDLRRRMGACGCRRAERRFSEKQMHAGYQRCFEEMLHG